MIKNILLLCFCWRTS